MQQTYTFLALLLCILVILLATCSCARVLRSCAATVMVFGPSLLYLECPPPGFRQQDQGADTSETK